MNKSVIYNGKTSSREPCSNPSPLKVGQEYEVVSAEPNYFQINYVLKGVEGTFCSTWFNELRPIQKKEFIAMSNTTPIIGLRLSCYRLAFRHTIFKNRRVKVRNIYTSPVMSVEELSSSSFSILYKVETENSIYYVMVK